MKADMNKCATDVYMTELGLAYEEIHCSLKNIDKWSRPSRRRTALANFHSRSYVLAEPYGVALIMSPWNYPILLCIDPLIGAISAGCTAVVKPASYAINTSHVIAKVIAETFPPEYIAVVEGGREENKSLLKQKFDYIFFTGSVAVGKEVMAAASEHLTPVTLELGGKSPVIVDQTAKINIAARRIAFGKVLNAGQTCVEPDYLLIHKSVKKPFIKAYKKALEEFFPDGDMSDMNVIINEKHYNRVARLLSSGKAVIGGGTDPGRRFIEPTLLDDVSPDSPIMQEEIFGPILPMLTYDNLDDCIRFINARPHPLALYVFTKDKSVVDKVFSSCLSGGACVNDTMMHLASTTMPFGGVGDSGMGGYHGKDSFDTFTHYCSVLDKGTGLDLKIRYRPYTEKKKKLIRKFVGG
jgi:aldehyde dehydrogenase (NAD+)